MPLAHEQAAIDTAQGARKEQLMEAALVLDRVRAEYPGVDNPHELPGPIRREALAAVAAFRGRGSSVLPTLVVSLLMLFAGSAALVLSPLRVFRCDPTGKGLAACVVSERALGLVTLREQKLEGIASAEAGSRVETSETRDSQGRVRSTHSTTVEQLVLKDASGHTLWQTTGSHFLGASFEDMSRDVTGLLSAGPGAPFSRTHEAWPPLLFGTLFVTIGLSSSISSLGLALRNRGFISPALHSKFYSVPLLLAALVCAVGWVFAFLGSDPPSWMVSALHLG